MAKSHLNPQTIKKVLAIEVNRLGDLISAIPAIKTLRANFPEAEFSLLIHEEFKTLVSNSIDIDSIITYPTNCTFTNLLKLLIQVRKENYDLICSLSPIRRNAFLAIFGRKRFSVGYLTFGRRIPNFLRKNKVRSLGFKLQSNELFHYENITQSALKVCKAMGLKPVELSPHISLPPGYDQKAEFILKSIGLPKEFSYIVLHPFAGWKYRALNEKQIYHLLCTLLQTIYENIIIIGAANERKNIETIIEKLAQPNRVFAYMGNNLLHVAHVIKQSRIFIGMDSGLLHLASALGTPAIGLFGPAPPSLTGPLSEKNVFLYHPVECSPCRQKRCIRKHDTCIQLITTEEIVSNVVRYFSHTNS